MKAIYWLIRYTAQMRRSLLISLMLFVLTGIAFIMTTYIQRWVIDEVFINSRYDLLIMFLGLMVIGAISANTLHAVGGLMMAKNELTLRKKLVLDYRTQLNRLSAEQFQKERTGEIMHAIHNELPETAAFVTQRSMNLVREIIQIIVLSIIICLSQPLMWLGLVIISVAYVWIGKLSFSKAEEIQRDKIELKSKYSAQLEEGISSTREVVSFNRHKWEKMKHHAAFSAYFNKVIEEIKWKNKQLFITEPVQWMPILFVMGYGGYSVLKGDLTLGLFIVIFEFSKQLLEGISTCYKLVMEMPYQKSVINRVHDKLNTDPMRKGTVALENICDLSLNDVTFRYDEGQRDVLHRVNINFPIGKKIAIVGSSGGGKSSIAKLLLRYFEPQSGQITINGMNMNEIQQSSWYDHVAYVPQEPYLLPESIAINITLGRSQFSLDDIKHACQIAQIDDWIETLPDRYDTMVGERGIQLSGGQRQRIAIARAIIERKNLIVMDEATSSLDHQKERDLQAALDREWELKTMIVIAHRLSTVTNSDSIIVLNDGSVADIGTHNELMQRCAIYKSLVNAEKKSV